MASRKYIGGQIKNTEVGRQLTIFSHYNGIPVVSSRTVREVFGKEHKNVLRDIEKLIEKIKQSEERTGHLGQLKSEPTYFYHSFYTDSRNRKQTEYLLTKDGFSLIVFGYGGKVAMDFKLA